MIPCDSSLPKAKRVVLRLRRRLEVALSQLQFCRNACRCVGSAVCYCNKVTLSYKKPYLINVSYGFLIHVFRAAYLRILRVSGCDDLRILYVYTCVPGFLYDREPSLP